MFFAGLNNLVGMFYRHLFSAETSHLQAVGIKLVVIKLTRIMRMLNL